MAASLMFTLAACAGGGGPEAAARAGFEEWAKNIAIAFRNVSYRTVSVQEAFATIEITVEFQRSPAEPWTEQQASVQVVKQGDQWRPPTQFVFGPSRRAVETMTTARDATATVETARAQATQAAAELVRQLTATAVAQAAQATGVAAAAARDATAAVATPAAQATGTAVAEARQETVPATPSPSTRPPTIAPPAQPAGVAAVALNNGTWQVLAGDQSGPARLINPTGVAVDDQGNVFVADYGNHRVLKLSSAGQLLVQWGSRGSGPGQFEFPAAVALDRQGNVYVVDNSNHRIQKLSPTGQPLAQWGDRGEGLGQFRSPYGVAVDSQGNIYVADAFNHRLQKLSPTGLPLAQWGTLGEGPGQFRAPMGVAVDSQDNIYVVDNINADVQKLTPTGQPLARWGSRGAGTGQFHGLSGIAVDRLDNIYVADAGNNRIQKLSAAGPNPSRSKSGIRLVLEVRSASGSPPDSRTVTAVAQRLEVRAIAMGISESTIQVRGESQISVELPGLDKPEEAIKVFQETGLLEFIDAGSTQLAEGTIVTTSLGGIETVTGSGRPGVSPAASRSYQTIVTSIDLSSAAVGFDPQTSRPVVQFTLTDEAGARFQEFTGRNIGKVLAITLDKRVIYAGTIVVQIGKEGVIPGLSLDEVQRLVVQLKSGPLDLPVDVVRVEPLS